MRHPLKWFLAALFLAVCGPVSAADLFTVAAVPVDQTAASASEARAVALANGQRVAYRTLMQRLTLREDQRRAPPVNDALLNELVQGLEIADERTSATRYIAKLTVSFRPNAVRGLLRENDIPYSETMSPPLVLLAVLENDQGRTLWNEPNPWRDAWAARDASADGTVRFTMPVGDLQDVQSVSAEQAVAGDADALKALASRYGAETLVVNAVLTPTGDAIGVTVQRLDAGSTVDSYTLSGPAGAAASYAGAVREVAARIEDDWKRQTLLRRDTPAALAVTVPLGGLTDWVAVRQKLAETPEVAGYEIAGMTSREARLTLNYFGDPRRLALALRGHGLTLAQNGDFWVLRPQTAPATP